MPQSSPVSPIPLTTPPSLAQGTSPGIGAKIASAHQVLEAESERSWSIIEELEKHLQCVLSPDMTEEKSWTPEGRMSLGCPLLDRMAEHGDRWSAINSKLESIVNRLAL